jgi:hypothetical protein
MKNVIILSVFCLSTISGFAKADVGEDKNRYAECAVDTSYAIDDPIYKGGMMAPGQLRPSLSERSNNEQRFQPLVIKLGKTAQLIVKLDVQNLKDRRVLTMDVAFNETLPDGTVNNIGSDSKKFFVMKEDILEKSSGYLKSVDGQIQIVNPEALALAKGEPLDKFWSDHGPLPKKIVFLDARVACGTSVSPVNSR